MKYSSFKFTLSLTQNKIVEKNCKGLLTLTANAFDIGKLWSVVSNQSPAALVESKQLTQIRSIFSIFIIPSLNIDVHYFKCMPTFFLLFELREVL